MEGLWNLFVIFGVPALLYYFVGAPFLEWWQTVRGLTGITFIPKQPEE